MSETMPKWAKGDWVRFYRNGALVIGAVEYVHRTVTGRVELLTDMGSVREDYVLEARQVVGVTPSEPPTS